MGETFMKVRYLIVATLVSAAAPLAARDGKSFNISLQHVSGESSTAGNALGMEAARDINDMAYGGLVFQSVTANPRYSGPGISLGLSNEAFNWGWKFYLDFADLSASKSEIVSQDYSSFAYGGSSTAITSSNILSFSSNKLQKASLGYTADIYAFRSGGVALQKLGIRLGGRLRSDDLKLSDSLVMQSMTVVANPGGTITIPLGLSFPNDHRLNYQEHALELLGGLSYKYGVTTNTALDVAATGVYGKGMGKYKHDAMSLATIIPTAPAMPSKTTFKGDTKLTRSGFLAEVGFSHAFSDKMGLRLSYGFSQIQSKVDESTVKNPNVMPLMAMVTGDFLPYIMDTSNPLGANPASTDSEQRIGLELKVGL